METELGIKDLKHLDTVLKNKYGFDISGFSLQSIVTKIHSYCKNNGIENFTDFLNGLKYQRPFFENFIEAFSENNNLMFSEPEDWKLLKEAFVKKFSTNKRIKVWMSGCQSGEDVYALGVFLHELHLSDKTSCYAHDVNPSQYNKAIEGKFPIEVLSSFEHNYTLAGGKESFNNYFISNGSHFVMKQELIKNVRFLCFDTMRTDPFNKFDLIICRNTIVNFHTSKQQKMLEQFYKGMNTSSILLYNDEKGILKKNFTDKFIPYEGRKNFVEKR